MPVVTMQEMLDQFKESMSPLYAVAPVSPEACDVVVLRLNTLLAEAKRMSGLYSSIKAHEYVQHFAWERLAIKIDETKWQVVEVRFFSPQAKGYARQRTDVYKGCVTLTTAIEEMISTMPSSGNLRPRLELLTHVEEVENDDSACH